MKLSEEVKKYIKASVLCWLATVDTDNIPNVSPKEIFDFYGEEYIIIANIASPGSVKNIKSNEWVAVSFIDILVQKGFQLKGKACIVNKDFPNYADMEKVLLEMTDGLFPFPSITLIKVEKIKPILAPRYLLFPETTEQAQIESARKTYCIEADL